MPGPDSLPTPSLIDRLSKDDLPGDGLDLDLAQASGKTGEIKVRRKLRLRNEEKPLTATKIQSSATSNGCSTLAR